MLILQIPKVYFWNEVYANTVITSKIYDKTDFYGVNFSIDSGAKSYGMYIWEYMYMYIHFHFARTSSNVSGLNETIIV